MTTEVTTVGPDTPFKAVALLLATWNISGAPVVDEDGLVLGVVQQGDLREMAMDPASLFDDRGVSPGPAGILSSHRPRS